MAGPGVFPKTGGVDSAYAIEYNKIDANLTLKSNLASSIINLAKQDFCNPAIPITYSYALVDVFTDSGGHYNTVASTTAFYYGSDLTGNFENTTCFTCVWAGTTTLCSRTGGAAGCYCCVVANNLFCNCSLSTGGAACTTQTICATYCISNTGFASATEFCFQFCYCNKVNSAGAGSCACLTLVGTPDDFTSNISSTGSSGESCLWCYCYVRVCTNCFAFYRNGSLDCCVTLSAFPIYCISSLTCALNAGGGNDGHAFAFISFTGYQQNLTQTCIRTTCQTYSGCPRAFFLKTDSSGSGTILMDVLKPSDCSVLLANIPANCVCYLNADYQNNYIYQIKQCSDALSCIRAYSVIVDNIS